MCCSAGAVRVPQCEGLVFAAVQGLSVCRSAGAECASQSGSSECAAMRGCICAAMWGLRMCRSAEAARVPQCGG